MYIPTSAFLSYYLNSSNCLTNVSNHELYVVCGGLPKSYLIKQLRSDMNALCHIQMTLGPNEGADIEAEQGNLNMTLY